MKLYRVTFTLGEGVDKRDFSIVAAEQDSQAAKQSVRLLIYTLTDGTIPQKVRSNAIIFGADGKGKSLNKLKK